MSDTRPSSLTRIGRILAWIVLALAAIWVLFEFVFPWVESRWYDPTIGVVGALLGSLGG